MKAYLDSLIPSKEPLAPAYHAAVDIVLADASAEDCEKVLEACEKALMKSPEAAVPVTRHLLKALPGDISSMAVKHVLPAVSSLSKSSVAQNRALAFDLWESLLAACLAVEARAGLVQEITSVLAKGKTTSADHKITLVRMLSTITPSDVASAEIVGMLAPLMARETAEQSMRAMAQALERHLAFSLQQGNSSPSKAVLQALAKDMANTKTIVRNQFADAVGSALWLAGRSSSGWSPEASDLAELAVPALLGYLKATSTATTPAGSSSNVIGALTEGYVAAAIGLAFLSSSASEKTQTALSKDPFFNTIGQLSPKPSFLLSERLQRRVIQEDTTSEPATRARTWLIRALDALLERHAKALGVQQRCVLED